MNHPQDETEAGWILAVVRACKHMRQKRLKGMAGGGREGDELKRGIHKLIESYNFTHNSWDGKLNHQTDPLECRASNFKNFLPIFCLCSSGLSWIMPRLVIFLIIIIEIQLQIIRNVESETGAHWENLLPSRVFWRRRRFSFLVYSSNIVYSLQITKSTSFQKKSVKQID